MISEVMRVYVIDERDSGDVDGRLEVQCTFRLVFQFMDSQNVSFLILSRYILNGFMSFWDCTFPVTFQWEI